MGLAAHSSGGASADLFMPDYFRIMMLPVFLALRPIPFEIGCSVVLGLFFTHLVDDCL